MCTKEDFNWETYYFFIDTLNSKSLLNKNKEPKANIIPIGIRIFLIQREFCCCCNGKIEITVIMDPTFTKFHSLILFCEASNNTKSLIFKLLIIIARISNVDNIPHDNGINMLVNKIQ